MNADPILWLAAIHLGANLAADPRRAGQLLLWACAILISLLVLSSSTRHQRRHYLANSTEV
jgi:hypothetical protein